MIKAIGLRNKAERDFKKINLGIIQNLSSMSKS